MSGVIAKEVKTLHQASKVEGYFKRVDCQEEQCALWDGVLSCCGDRSLFEQERVGLRGVIEDLVAHYENIMTAADKARVQTEAQVKEIGDHPPHAGLFEEMGKRRSQVATMAEVIDSMRLKFRV